jgi:hypothetical protein
VTEQRSRGKSVFHFDVQGSVAKSTHAGLPWLLFLRCQTDAHSWPFDGWTPVPGRSVIAEAYPSLWRASYPKASRTADQHDAYSIARGFQERDAAGDLERCFHPEVGDLPPDAVALEGWILGVL